MGAVRELRNRRCAAAAVADVRMPGVPNFPVGPDSDSDDGVQPPCRASALSPMFRKGPGSPNDGSGNLPLLAHPSCTKPSCDKAGSISMVPCDGNCDNLLHPTCGFYVSMDDSGRSCSSCSGTTLGKRRSRS